MTVRRNPITGESVLFAPDRAARPRAFGGADVSRCPFCPGHEDDTPPETYREGEPWTIRVFPNKFPPVEGAEVIVESPDHDATFDAVEHAEDLVRSYVQRYRAHVDAAYVCLFKNHGPAAGSSIPHIHSQIVPLPFLPARVQRETDAFRRGDACPLCARIAGSEIMETEHWTWIAPEGSWMPYQQWIVPRRHVAAFRDLGELEIRELATLLRSSSAAMLRIGGAYNWAFADFAHERAGHCYVDAFPRLTTIAGLELGTGTFVEIIDPAAAARRLRGSD